MGWKFNPFTGTLDKDKIGISQSEADLRYLQTEDAPLELPALDSGKVLSNNGTVLQWVAAPSGGVSSVNSAGGTLTVSPTTGDVDVSLNLSHANTWAALQTFGNNISLGGAALNVSSLATNDLLRYNGTNWVNVAATSLGLTNTVSNSDGSLTISPTSGAVVASVNKAHNYQWTGTHQFDNTATFNSAVNGLTQRGITSNTSQSISSGFTYDLNITLADSNNKFARILIRRQTGVLLPREFCVIWCTNATSLGHSIAFSTTYNVSYSMAQGDSYLSQQIFSSASSGIRVHDAYITSNTLRIVFFNGDGLSRTLNAYIDWEVWKG